MTNWLDELQVGDEVVEGNDIRKVTAIHKLHIVCGLSKYSKKTGHDISSYGWVTRKIEQVTEKRKQEIADFWERSNLRSRLIDLRYEHVVRNASKETLMKLVDIIEAEKNRIKEE